MTTLVESDLNSLFYLCYPLVRDASILLAYFQIRRNAIKGKERNASMIGTNSSKMHLVSYNSCA